MSYLKIDKYGNKFWYNDNGQLHREGGPAIEFNYGPKLWYINGKYHREDGPAVECNSGTKYWYINGIRHREDGPAEEFFDGTKIWWYDNVCIGSSYGGFTQEKFERYVRELKIKEYW